MNHADLFRRVETVLREGLQQSPECLKTAIRYAELACKYLKKQKQEWWYKELYLLKYEYELKYAKR